MSRGLLLTDLEIIETKAREILDEVAELKCVYFQGETPEDLVR